MPRTLVDASRRKEKAKKIRARLARRYDIISRDFNVGSLTIPFTMIRNPDSVLDQVVAEADRREKISGQKESDEDLHLPYWAELWDSAFGIGEYLISHPATPSALHPLSVLDLGCGMGFAGTVAAALGHRVLFADIETDPLLFAQLNALTFAETRARKANWRRDRLGELFDLIVGADVLYDKSQWDFLDAFWQAHLAPNGNILLGEPGRQTGDMFLIWLALRDHWKLERTEQRVKSREKPIRLFRLFR